MQCILGVTAIAAALFCAAIVATGFAAEAKAPAGNPTVIFETSLGSISIELYPDKAPLSVRNFLAYVDDGFYNSTVFHRVIPKFMIQGGGFTKDLQQKKANPPIKNEADNGLCNSRGTIAMARTQEVNSATSQFFINIADNSFLDHGVRDFGYAVFGKVTAGMDIVDKIAAVRTGTVGRQQDVPLEPVIVTAARRK